MGKDNNTLINQISFKFSGSSFKVSSLKIVWIFFSNSYSSALVKKDMAVLIVSNLSGGLAKVV